MVQDMKMWKKMMVGFMVTAMAGTMSFPVMAAEEAEPTEISEAMLGLWQDSVGDIYGFYADNTFFGQWQEEQEDVVGAYALVTDGEYTALALDFGTGDETITYKMIANTEENMLELYDDSEELVSTLVPYEGTGEEEDYNEVYQEMGQLLTECYKGETDSGETFVYAGNEDGTFCSVLVIDDEDNYCSFIGEGSYDEENNIITITDEVSEMSLGFEVIPNEDGTITLDLGDLGSATLEEAAIANAVQALKYATENGTPVN